MLPSKPSVPTNPSLPALPPALPSSSSSKGAIIVNVFIHRWATSALRSLKIGSLTFFFDSTQMGKLHARGYGDHTPMQASTLANAIARLTERELHQLLQATVGRLVQRRLLWTSHGRYALDTSDLPTSAKFKGTGRRTTTERRRTKAGEWVQTPHRL